MSNWRTHTRNEHQAAIVKTDRAVSLMIRERNAEQVCIACGKAHATYDAGHYRRRELMATRFHPMNLNAEGLSCSRGTHYTKFSEKDMDLYRENIDARWGADTAQFLFKLSQNIEAWETRELEQLRAAAKYGARVYEQVYRELRPTHFPMG